MTDLTNRVQRCGLHTCDCQTCSISVKEAQAAINEVKQACIDAVMKLPARGDMRRMAIQAIKNVS